MITITNVLIGLVSSLHVLPRAGDVPVEHAVWPSCLIVAAVYGGLTATRKILFVQALPAAVALVATSNEDSATLSLTRPVCP